MNNTEYPCNNYSCCSVYLGVGAGLTHIPATCIIGEYFATSYTQANGLAHVGPGLGLVVYPPLLERLIYTFGWRGSFLIEGAIAFHIVAAACLFRPVRKSDDLHQTELKAKYQSVSSVEVDGANDNGDRNRQVCLNLNAKGSSGIICRTSCNEDVVVNVNCSNEIANNDNTCRVNKRCDLIQDFEENAIGEHYDSGIKIVKKSRDDRYDSTKVSNYISAKESQTVSNGLDNCAKEKIESTVYFQEDSEGSWHRFSNNGLGDRYNPIEDHAKSFLEDTVNPQKDKYKTRLTRFRTRCLKYYPTVPILYTCMLAFLLGVAWLAVLSHGVATAIETGASESQASLVLSVMGASSIVSRLTHGYCIDRGWISVLGTEVFMLVLATISTCVNLFIDGFVVLMVFATCSGFASGVFFTLLPVIIRQIDTKDRMPYNMGLVFAVGAVGDLSGGYFAGNRCTVVFRVFTEKPK